MTETTPLTTVQGDPITPGAVLYTTWLYESAHQAYPVTVKYTDVADTAGPATVTVRYQDAAGWDHQVLLAPELLFATAQAANLADTLSQDAAPVEPGQTVYTMAVPEREGQLFAALVVSVKTGDVKPQDCRVMLLLPDGSYQGMHALDLHHHHNTMPGV